jgi:hypothetical protein
LMLRLMLAILLCLVYKVVLAEYNQHLSI